MTQHEVLRPAVAARRIGVGTLAVLEVMHEQRVPRVRLADGTLGIPLEALGRLSEAVRAGVPNDC